MAFRHKLFIEYADEESSPVMDIIIQNLFYLLFVLFIYLFVLLQLAPSISLHQPGLALASHAVEPLGGFSFNSPQVSIPLVILPFIFTAKFPGLIYALKKAFPMNIKYYMHTIIFYTFGRNEHINPIQKEKKRNLA